MADIKTTHLQLTKQDPNTLPDYLKSDSNLDLLDEEIWARGKTFNGEPVSPIDGGFHVDTIPLAEDLKTASNQLNTGDYIIRTTGGDASIKDGSAQLTGIIGKNRHENYSEQVVSMATAFVSRPEGEEITATIDDAAFIGAVSDASGTQTFTYLTDAWDTDPLLYGITIVGTPVDGDEITVTYAKEVRGTIYVSTPTSFISTGWNLFDYSNGYARVCKYSEEYGFKISGTYTALAFAESLSTPPGERIEIEPDSNGLFNIPSDGYVFVTGGNNTNTAIWMTWSDWINGYKWNPNTSEQGSFETYASMVSEVNFNSAIQSIFPYGLLSAGTVHDEINFVVGYAYKRVSRIAYSNSNLISAIASGRQFEYDENYIYLADASETQFEISVNSQYQAYDHGMEIFSGTTQEVTGKTSYGASLRNKLERDVLTASQQTLTTAQKYQVLSNIGVDLQDPSVDFPAVQDLADFTSRIDTMIDNAPRRSLVGVGFIPKSNVAENINLPFSGHAIAMARQGTKNQRCVVVFDNSKKGIAILRKVSGVWQTAWDLYNWLESAEATSESAIWTDSNILFRKKNGIVFARINAIELSAHTVATKIGTIPAGFRPLVNTYCPVYGSITVGNTVETAIRFDTNGDIVSYESDAGQKWGNITYIAADE